MKAVSLLLLQLLRRLFRFFFALLVVVARRRLLFAPPFRGAFNAIVLLLMLVVGVGVAFLAFVRLLCASHTFRLRHFAFAHGRTACTRRRWRATTNTHPKPTNNVVKHGALFRHFRLLLHPGKRNNVVESRPRQTRAYHI